MRPPLLTVYTPPIGEESPSSAWAGRLLTAAGGDPRESATEIIPPRAAQRVVRVKW